MLITADALVVVLSLDIRDAHAAARLLVDASYLGVPKANADIANGDGAGERTCSWSHTATVVAGSYDPLTVLLADNLADVMWPDHHSANVGGCRRAHVRPIARKPEFAALLAMYAKLIGHFSAAPCHAVRSGGRDIAAVRDSTATIC
jgi:hypothetical protein